MMEGVLAVAENRARVDDIEKFKKDAFKKAQESARREQTIDNVIDVTKKVVEIGGTVATVVMTIIPFDGVAGELAVILATPALSKAIENCRSLLKGVFVKRDGKEIISSFSDLYDNYQILRTPDINQVKDLDEGIKHAHEERELGVVR